MNDRALDENTGMTKQRTEPATNADERSMLEGWLDYHRETLEMKCAGLDDAQLRTASVEPSELSLLGLVRHMAEVERGWFRKVLRLATIKPCLQRGGPGRRVPSHRRGHLGRGVRHLAGRDRDRPAQRGSFRAGRRLRGQEQTHR